jgi:hypothetical protein
MTAESAAARAWSQAPDIGTPALKALAKLAGAERIDAVSRGADQGSALRRRRLMPPRSSRTARRNRWIARSSRRGSASAACACWQWTWIRP